MNLKKNCPLAAKVLALLFCAALSSCEKKLGYSIVLWSDKNSQVYEGEVVPVYSRSNIFHFYIIENPQTREKIEIPVWQITEPVSKMKIKRLQAQYAEYDHTYASVKADGLPVRAKPDNTARQVYRLRKGEEIRVLYKGEGAPVMSGRDSRMEGDWLFVLASDGTQGWCFSYSLSLFKKSNGQAEKIALPAAEQKDEDFLPNSILNSRWYPESFSEAVSVGDFSSLNPEYGFYPGGAGGKVRIYTRDYDLEWDFEGVTKSGKSYKYKGVNITLTPDGSDALFVHYTGSDGKAKMLRFVKFADSLDLKKPVSSGRIPDERISNENASGGDAAERTRHPTAFQQILKAGPKFSGGKYGTLAFFENEKFLWAGYSLLVPEIVPTSASGSGVVQIKYALDDALAGAWDGALTMLFDGSERECNFLFKIGEGELLLADASRLSEWGGVLKAADFELLTMSFKRER